jgi:hypothetical protein
MAGLPEQLDATGRDERLEALERARLVGLELLEEHAADTQREARARATHESREDLRRGDIAFVRDAPQGVAIERVIEIRDAGANVEDAISAAAVGLMELEVEADVQARWEVIGDR